MALDDPRSPTSVSAPDRRLGRERHRRHFEGCLVSETGRYFGRSKPRRFGSSTRAGL
jgi:hypothetical protein